MKEYCKEMNEKGVKTGLLPANSKISVLFAAKKIFKYLKENQIKVIHSHLFSADLIAVIIKKLYFKKLVILSTKHGYQETFLLQYGMGRRKIRYNPYYFISKAVITNIDHNITVSKTLSDLYQFLKIGKTNMKAISHGINPVLPQKHKELEGTPKIITVGRLSEIKGHAYLFKAMPEIILKFPELKLYILGVGPFKEKLQNLAKDLNILNHIEFVGFANPAEYIPDCHVMVLPTFFESFGLVFTESFALKIPVITFDTEAGNQIIDNNETGILVGKENITELTEKIIFLLQSPEERERISENAYKAFKKYYNAERMAKETAEWYHSVLTS
jgi:glycosyltransferase involved in cell wall biosynthesis